jgi:hypothetical protein
MKKSTFILFLTFTVLNLAQGQNEEPKPAYSQEYFSYNFSKSIIGKNAQVLKVTNLSDEEYTRYSNLITDVKFNSREYTFKMEVQKADIKKTIIVMPLLDNTISLAFVENDVYDYLSIIQIKITQDGKYMTSQFRGRRTKAQCKDEAGDLQNLAGGIASLSLIGCIVCGFAGGATLGIISFMAYFC